MSTYRLGGILIAKEEISTRVKKLATQIQKDNGVDPVLLVGVLKGSVVFLSDLIRCMSPSTPVELDFLAVSSYGASTQSSGIVKITKDLDEEITGRKVLLVEDIVDTGLTLHYLVNILRERSPKTIGICTLLDKPDRRRVSVDITYRGFEIPDEFVVGYGLDYSGRWRNLPDIHVLRTTI
ncbi:MAG: hypoxanthine phosphoribosyltransferase [Thermovirgaceae bacterium]